MKYIVKSEIHAGTKVEPLVLEAGKVLSAKEVEILSADLEALVAAGALAAVEEEKAEEEAPADDAEAPAKKKGKK